MPMVPTSSSSCQEASPLMLSTKAQASSCLLFPIYISTPFLVTLSHSAHLSLDMLIFSVLHALVFSVFFLGIKLS